MRISLPTLAAFGLALGLGFTADSPAAAAPSAAETLRERLSETGLYADVATKQIAPGLIGFTPQYPLWSDGARKQRWISLPPGSSIDATDPDAWVFPVGTRLWKEFAFGRRVETRFLELTADGWQFATYRWLEDESDALLAPKFGARAVYEVPAGGAYDLPARSDCRACHEGNVSRVLGFSALQLSGARDPGAPHAEPLRAGDVDLAELVERGWLVGLPAGLVASPPEIPARSGDERAALGYLHGNCASCHNGRGPLADLDFSLEVRLGSGVSKPGALLTGVDRNARFQPAGSAPKARLAPGHPEASLLLERMSRRDPISQMPPLGSRVVDHEAVALVERWIRQGLFQPQDIQTASKGEKP
jgi:hypothetical protein